MPLEDNGGGYVTASTSERETPTSPTSAYSRCIAVPVAPKGAARCNITTSQRHTERVERTAARADSLCVGAIGPRSCPCCSDV
jgi:hypothetical protein